VSGGALTTPRKDLDSANRSFNLSRAERDFLSVVSTESVMLPMLSCGRFWSIVPLPARLRASNLLLMSSKSLPLPPVSSFSALRSVAVCVCVTGEEENGEGGGVLGGFSSPHSSQSSTDTPSGATGGAAEDSCRGVVLGNDSVSKKITLLLPRSEVDSSSA
jgi:hypothetical protein